jgi:hypothetical protein
MIFHKYKLIITGIPKNASTSIFEVLKNNTDSQHDHHTILEDYSNNDTDLMESYSNICVVRNPYDRFISGCHQIRRDEQHQVNLTLDEIFENFIQKSDWLNDAFRPQHKFVCFGNTILMDHVLKYENLREDWMNFATEYNKTSQFKIKTKLPQFNTSENRKPWQEELKELSNDNYESLNHFYEKDFKIFKYEIIERK